MCGVICHMIMYLFLHWLHNKIGCIVEGINSESAKIQDTQMMSDRSRSYTVNFLEGVCDTVPVAEVLVSS